MLTGLQRGSCRDRVFDRIAHEPDGGIHGEDPRAAADHLLEDVVLGGGADLLFRISELLGHGLVHGQHDGGHRVDRQPGSDPVQGNVLEGDLEIPQGVHRHADPADFPHDPGVIRIVAHLGRQVEGDVQAGLAVGDHQLEALVGLLRGAEAGVLPGRPGPAAVALRMQAAREREFSRIAEVFFIVKLDRREIFRRVAGLDPDAGLINDFPDAVLLVFDVLRNTHGVLSPAVLAVPKKMVRCRLGARARAATVLRSGFITPV